MRYDNQLSRAFAEALHARCNVPNMCRDSNAFAFVWKNLNSTAVAGRSERNMKSLDEDTIEGGGRESEWYSALSRKVRSNTLTSIMPET